MNRRKSVFALAALGAAQLASKVARSDNHRGDGLSISGTVTSPSTEIGATNQRTGVFYGGNNGPASAVYAAIAGDVILVRPGTYDSGKFFFNAPVTMRTSVPGQRPVIRKVDNTSRFLNWGPWAGGTLTIEDMEFVGLKKPGIYYPNQGYACAYPEGGTYDFVMRRCKISEFDGAVVAGRHRDGTFLFEDCEFDNNGNYQGFTHNVYVDDVGSLTMRGCWSHTSKSRADYLAQYGAGNEWRVSWGHLVKSRAMATTLEGCRFTHERGESNRCIDVPNGGVVVIRGCLLELGRSPSGGQGQQFVGYGIEEGGGNANPVYLPAHTFHFEQNTCVNHGQSRHQWLSIFTAQDQTPKFPVPSVFSVRDNVFAGLVDNPYTNTWLSAGQSAATYQPSRTLNTFISEANMNTQMPGHATYDFRLATPVVGSQNWADYVYVHPASKAVRTDSYRGSSPPS